MTILTPEQMPLMRPMPMEKTDKLRRWRLEENYFLRFKYKYLYAPKGFIFDGASIPRLFRRIYSPTGYLFLAGLFHDLCYKNAEYKWRGTISGTIHTRPVTQEMADKLFKNISNFYYKEHCIKTRVAYRALRIGGSVAWNRHRGIITPKFDPSKTHVEEMDY